jgi:hypothetical protein
LETRAKKRPIVAVTEPPSELRRLQRFLARDGAAQYELDLTGLDLPHSLASIDRMVERQRFRPEPRSVKISLDPATPDSGETLFLPIGRHLIGLMRRDLVSRCQPMPNTAGAGFLIHLPGSEAKDGT